MKLPSFKTYCDNTTAVNAQVFDLGNGVRVFYSYTTPVAFEIDGKRYVRRNEWAQTTGKHLNAIDKGDKKSRIDGKTFERMLADAIATKEVQR